MDNTAIAKLFDEIANLLEIKGENAFKIRAYQRAVRTIENLTEPLKNIRERNELKSIDGIGKAIAEKIEEALDTGEIRVHKELKESMPEGILNLMEIPSMGPKTVKLVHEKLGITDIDSLKQAAEAGQIAELPGMGKKSQEKILKGIENAKQSTGRHHLRRAANAANDILERLRKIKGVKKAEYAGSLRRGKETVGDLDILVSAKDSQPVMEEFLKTDGIQEVIAQGEKKTSIVLSDNMQVDLRVVSEASFGAAMQYFTGSKEHNVKLREMAVKRNLKINEYGVYEADSNKKIAGKTEKEVYETLGLKYIPPELREGMDELELASGTLPKLIELKHLKSALHNHTTESDGKMPLEQLVEEAKNRGFEYIAVTDHSVALGVANGLSAERLKKQIDEIRKFNEKHPDFPVLAGNEVDVMSDASFAYDDELMAEMDIVIASLHIAHEQPREKIMKRLFAAMEHPHVDIIAHPSGRLIGRRPPMDIDYEALFSKAAETGTVLEINSHFLRLDLNDQHIREAKEHGVLFTINTDTHAATDFDNIEFGIKTARRGRLEAKDVINTYSLSKLKKTLKRYKN